MSVHIFVESASNKPGKETNEQCFMRQYAKHLKPEAQVEIVGVGGKDRLHFFTNQMIENTKKGDINLVVFDCDSNENGGGLERRIAEMERLKEKQNVEFDYFLFPNNSDEGAFEDLLLKIINQTHDDILECFKCFEGCIQRKDAGRNIYKVPNKKAKIYTYIETFKKSGQEEEDMKNGDWQFANAEYWNLDDPYLNPLKEFLCRYL